MRKNVRNDNRNLFLIESLAVEPNEQQLLLETKRDTIIRFISIIQRLQKVYKLPDSSLHIFYLEGSTIAFNKNGALFLNLRYYEAWREYTIIAAASNTNDLVRRCTSSGQETDHGHDLLVLHFGA